MNKGSWLRFVIAGGLLAVLVPASAQAAPGFDIGPNGPGKVEEAPAQPDCTVVGSTLMCGDEIKGDEPSGQSREPASNPVPAASTESGLDASWLFVALGAVLAGTAGSIFLMRRRPHALS